MHHPLRQQGEGLLAGSWEGEQAKTAATAEFAGQQPDGRITGGNNQGVGRCGCGPFAKLPFLVDAIMADDSKIGRFGGIHEFASGNRCPPIPARFTAGLPGPGRFPGTRRTKLKKILDAAIQCGSQGQGGGSRWHKAVGLDRTHPAREIPALAAKSSWDHPRAMRHVLTRLVSGCSEDMGYFLLDTTVVTMLSSTASFMPKENVSIAIVRFSLLQKRPTCGTSCAMFVEKSVIIMSIQPAFHPLVWERMCQHLLIWPTIIATLS